MEETFQSNTLDWSSLVIFCKGIKEKCAVLFLREDGYFWFIDFSFQFYTRYGSMDKERQLSVWSLPIFFHLMYRYALLNVLSNQINDTVLSTA